LLSKGYEVHGTIRRASTFNTERIDHLYQDPHVNAVQLFLPYGDIADSTNLIKASLSTSAGRNLPPGGAERARDNYNPERSHVVAALIRKWLKQRMPRATEVNVWGAGKAIREFLYIADCAEAILRATELYDDTRPLNIGTGTRQASVSWQRRLITCSTSREG
jgi:hypothetical protein